MLLATLICVLIVASTSLTPTSINITCLSKPRAACFLGKCPDSMSCLNGMCCNNKDIVKQKPDCHDFLEGCEVINCDLKEFYEFARANCAKTCNFCDDKPLAPQYNCKDILDDCKNRVEFCSDLEFSKMMALYCPRTCSRCDFSDFNPADCRDTFQDCSERGREFCENIKTSSFQLTVGCGKYCNIC